MSADYRLATFAHRGYMHTGVEVAGWLIELGHGYEHYKKAVGRRDFFKAKHNYSMVDVMDEWELFNDACGRMAEYFRPQLGTDAAGLPFAFRPEDVSFLPPIVNPNKVLNAGSNYYDHAMEMGAAKPDKEAHEPYFFYKGSRNNVIGHGEAIHLTPRSNYVDWEAELAVVIGRTAKNVPAAEALNYVAGYTCYNDISARDRMRRQGETFDYDWFSNKGNDTFAPLGPYIVPAQFIADPQNLALRCYVSGQLMQDTNTNLMVWSVAELIATASSVTTLSPGDIIATGTGGGVGMAQNRSAVGHDEMPSLFEHMYSGKARLLQPGDTVAVEIENVGRLENPVVGY